jgi:hypothetical protein
VRQVGGVKDVIEHNMKAAATPQEVDTAFKTISERHFGGVLVSGDPFLIVSGINSSPWRDRSSLKPEKRKCH